MPPTMVTVAIHICIQTIPDGYCEWVASRGPFNNVNERGEGSDLDGSST